MVTSAGAATDGEGMCSGGAMCVLVLVMSATCFGSRLVGFVSVRFELTANNNLLLCSNCTKTPHLMPRVHVAKPAVQNKYQGRGFIISGILYGDRCGARKEGHPKKKGGEGNYG